MIKVKFQCTLTLNLSMENSMWLIKISLQMSLVLWKYRILLFVTALSTFILSQPKLDEIQQL